MGSFDETYDAQNDRTIQHSPLILQVADKIHATSDHCNQFNYRSYLENYQNMFCFADRNCKTHKECQSIYNGDSGGPVACKKSDENHFGNVVHGIDSFLWLG